MKRVIFSAAVAFASFTSMSALADGFVCAVDDEALNIKVYNHTQPEEGTRNAAVMVLSNQDVGFGRKTIATFASEGTLRNAGTSYFANVDLRFTGSSRAGELIAGTKLGQLKSIRFHVDYNYSYPLEDGDVTNATLVLVKRNGEKINLAAVCDRYLNN